MQEKPLDVEQFFMTRNEIASRHNNKLEFQAMSRVREHLVEDQAPQVATQEVATESKEKKGKK